MKRFLLLFTILATVAGQSRATVTFDPVEPFTVAMWNQSTPFYLKCPRNTAGKLTMTGCVATAMGELMYHYRYPASADADNLPYRVIMAAGDTVRTVGSVHSVYDWSQLLPSYGAPALQTDAQNDAVGQLLLDCGLAVAMRYGQTGSAANTSDVAYALCTVFGYANAQWADHDYYTTDEWHQLIYDQLMAGRPVIHAGTDPDSHTGHAFVLDGIDAEGRVHAVWGYGKSAHEYVDLEQMNPTTASTINGRHYITDRGIVFNVEPTEPDGYVPLLQVCTAGRAYSVAAPGGPAVELTVDNLFNASPRTADVRLFACYESADGLNASLRVPVSVAGADGLVMAYRDTLYTQAPLTVDITPADLPAGDYKVSLVACDADGRHPQVVRQRHVGPVCWPLTKAADGTVTVGTPLAETTAVSSPVAVSSSAAPAFTLSGRRAASTSRGIVIRQGRKYLVR